MPAQINTGKGREMKAASIEHAGRALYAVLEGDVLRPVDCRRHRW